jgi:hypothetical protein
MTHKPAGYWNVVGIDCGHFVCSVEIKPDLPDVYARESLT